MRQVQRGEQAPSADAALDALCRTYWEPVRRYLKALGCAETESADVTQDFFASFLRNGGFERANPDLAKLRTFIKLASGSFLSNHWRKKHALRRGGSQSLENLDDVPEPAAQVLRQAEETYDREWAQAMLDRALRQVQEDYAKRGRAVVFEAVKAGLLRPGALENIAGVAAQLGVPEAQIRVAVHRARQRLAEALRQEVAATVESPDEVEPELRYLIGVIAHAQ